MLRNSDNINVQHADLNNTNYDNTSAKNANYSHCDMYQARLSLCHVEGTNFSYGNLQQATMLCSFYSNETNFEHTDVTWLLLLGTTTEDGKSITREFLKEKQAINPQKAITSLEELDHLLSNNFIPTEIAELYRDRINYLYGILNSLRIRLLKNMEINKEWPLSFATDTNLNILKQAYFMIDNHLIKLANTTQHTSCLYTVTRMKLNHRLPKELSFTFKPHTEKVKALDTANQIANFIFDKSCPKKMTVIFPYHAYKYAYACPQKIIFDKLAIQKCEINIHFIIHFKEGFSSLVNLVKSPNCPENINIDIHSELSKSEYETLLTAITENKTIKKSEIGLRLGDDSIASSFLSYMASGFSNNRIRLSILSYNQSISSDIIYQINKIQTKIAALICVTLLQGHRHQTNPLHKIPLELLETIFQLVLPGKKEKIETPKIYTSPSLLYKRLDEANLQMLVKKYQLPDSSQTSLEKCLRNAANNNCIDDLILLVTHVKNINAKDSNPVSQKTALHWAAVKGHRSCIDILLKAGASVDIPDASGQTPQMYIEKQALIIPSATIGS